MRLKSLDLIGAALIVVLTLAVTFFGLLTGAGDFPAWFLPFGILMVLFIPGYAITLAILPHLEWAATLLLSLGISISMAILGGFILHYTSWGLTPYSWAIWLSVISLPSCLVALYRRRLHPQEDTVRTSPLRWSSTVIVTFLMTGMLIIAAIIIARYSAIQSGSTFTQLWAIPGMDEDGYTIQIGIHNEEYVNMAYNLIAESQGKTIEEWNNIELGSGKTWETTLLLADKPDSDITFLLYKTNTPEEEYRRVHLAPASFDEVMAPNAH
jgi:uncharacterized membrane protein